ALRIVGGGEVQDGFVTNIASDEEGRGRVTNANLRALLSLTPSEKLTVTLTGMAQRIDANDHGSVDLLTPGVSGPIGEFDQWRLTPTPMTDNFDMLAAELKYKLEWAELASV